MAIFRHRRSEINLSRISTLWTITLVCICFLWISVSSVSSPNKDVPSFTKDGSITRRDTGVETVAQLSERFSQGDLPRPTFTGSNGKSPQYFTYKNQQNQMQSTWIEAVGGSEPSAKLARTLGFRLAEVGTVVPSRIRKKPSKGPSQGQAFWNNGIGPYPLSLLLQLYDQSPGSKFIYEAFAIGNSIPQLMMPVPEATLASLLSSSNVNREQLIAHVVDLLLGLQHMLQKKVAYLFATPSMVFISTKPDSNEIALMQWGISEHVTECEPRERAAYVDTDDLAWLSPEQHKFKTSSFDARRSLNYGEQASTVFTVALMALAALTVHNNKFDADNFNKLAEALQNNPYNTQGPSAGNIQSTQAVLQGYYGAGGALQEPGLDETTAEVFAHVLCAERFRENIDYLIIKWPTLYEVKNAEPGGPPPEYFEAEC